VKFHYTRYSDTASRPVVRIGVHHGQQSFGYVVLVDSGADINVFGQRLTEALGIKLETGVPAEVAGATDDVLSVYAHPVELTVADHTFTAQMAFIPRDSPTGLVRQRGFLFF
jgi:hypothetical protein